MIVEIRHSLEDSANQSSFSNTLLPKLMSEVEV